MKLALSRLSEGMESKETEVLTETVETIEAEKFKELKKCHVSLWDETIFISGPADFRDTDYRYADKQRSKRFLGGMRVLAFIEDCPNLP